MAELKGFEAHLITGRGVKVEVDDDLVTIKIISEHEGMVPFDFQKEPSFFDEAIKKMKEVNPDFKPACLMLQLKDMVKYRYERIL
jgi:hypothetical protein